MRNYTSTKNMRICRNYGLLLTPMACQVNDLAVKWGRSLDKMQYRDILGHLALTMGIIINKLQYVKTFLSIFVHCINVFYIM